MGNTGPINTAPATRSGAIARQLQLVLSAPWRHSTITARSVPVASITARQSRANFRGR